MGMSRLEHGWDHPEDTVYDDWKEIHGVRYAPPLEKPHASAMGRASPVAAEQWPDALPRRELTSYSLQACVTFGRLAG